MSLSKPSDKNNASLQEQFNELLDTEKCWECDLYYNEAEDIEADPVHVNLSDFFKNEKPYLFPPHVCGPGHLDKLLVSLQMASIKSGFILIKSSNKSTQFKNRNSAFEIYITLCCQSSILYAPTTRTSKKTSTKRKTSTRRSKTHKCNFRCNLKMYKMTHENHAGRWVLTGVKGKYRPIYRSIFASIYRCILASIYRSILASIYRSILASINRSICSELSLISVFYHKTQETTECTMGTGNYNQQSLQYPYPK